VHGKKTLYSQLSASNKNQSSEKPFVRPVLGDGKYQPARIGMASEFEQQSRRIGTTIRSDQIEHRKEFPIIA